MPDIFGRQFKKVKFDKETETYVDQEDLRNWFAQKIENLDTGRQMMMSDNGHIYREPYPEEVKDWAIAIVLGHSERRNRVRGTE